MYVRLALRSFRLVLFSFASVISCSSAALAPDTTVLHHANLSSARSFHVSGVILRLFKVVFSESLKRFYWPPEVLFPRLSSPNSSVWGGVHLAFW